MEIYEKINELIKEKNITKRKFADNLRLLSPKLKSTGETPTEKTIYKYLSGDINIPIELIPYIAETFDIAEQELFDTNHQTKLKLLKFLTKNLDKNQFAYMQNITTMSSIVNDVKIQYGKENETSYSQAEITKLLSLIEFAPLAMINKTIKKLEEIKKIALSDI